MLNKNDKVLIAGQEGLVGAALYNLLKKENIKIIECKRNKLDFTNYHEVNKFFKKNKPNIVINAAGKVGGILDNSRFPIEYLDENIKIGFNIVNASYKTKVKKLINLGSACIYPKKTKLPIREDYLLTGSLEKTNEGYALAKIATLKLCEYFNKFKNKDFISIQPANLYGNNDNFDLKSSHVIPALIRKFYEAKKYNKKYVEIWGSGNSKREFLHVEDLVESIYFLLKYKKKIKHAYLNIGSGEEISIKTLARIIKKISGYEGRIVFNLMKPDGQTRRIMNCQLINKLGWKSSINIKQGLNKVYDYYKKNTL
jgi:GDP-L-fucose synthase